MKDFSMVDLGILRCTVYEKKATVMHPTPMIDSG